MNRVRYLDRYLFFLLPYFLFSLVSFLYFGFFADYITFYQEKRSLFIFSSEYLIDNLQQPGGFLIYLGSFLSTFFYHPALGSLIVTTIICLIVYFTYIIINISDDSKSFFIPLMAGVTVFILQTNYQYLIYNNLALLLQLAFFYLSIKFYKSWVIIILIPLWYFVTGGFAWIFCIMLALHLALNEGKKGLIKNVALFSLVLLVIYFSKEFLFFQTLKALMFYPYSNNDIGFQFRLFIPVAGFFSVIPLITRIKVHFPLSGNILGYVLKSIKVLIPLALLIIFAYLRYNIEYRQYFQVEKMFYQRDFERIITFNIKNPSNNILTIYLNNIALCETGKLNDILFHFRQSPDGQTLFLKWEMSGEILKLGGYFYYTIGMINEAHRWAFENMVIKGHTPEGLKMLIKTELINNNYNMASKYITLLKKTAFYRKEAIKYDHLLLNDSSVASDPELGEKRRLKIKCDFFTVSDDPFGNIEKVLTCDSLNRNAFEYKLAFHMLREDYEEIVNNLPKLERYGFTKIPVHVEEAILVYSLMNKGKYPATGSFTISKSTISKFNQLLQSFQLYNNDPDAAKTALRQRFKNTFWYYAFYR